MTSAVDLRRWFLLQNPLADNRPGVLYFVRAGSLLFTTETVWRQLQHRHLAPKRCAILGPAGSRNDGSH